MGFSKQKKQSIHTESKSFLHVSLELMLYIFNAVGWQGTIFIATIKKETLTPSNKDPRCIQLPAINIFETTEKKQKNIDSSYNA